MTTQGDEPLGARLLIIDDDVKLSRLLQDYLQPLGYVVDLVHNGVDGLQRALTGGYDALILDLMLPGMNGLDVLRELRRQSSVPVLMLTALGDEPDRIAGLEIGADDYLPKTFSTRELLARLRAVLRRSRATVQQRRDEREAPVSVGDIWIDPSERRVAVGGTALALTAIEFDRSSSQMARSVGRVEDTPADSSGGDGSRLRGLRSLGRRALSHCCARNWATTQRIPAISRRFGRWDTGCGNRHPRDRLRRILEDESVC